MRLAIATDHRGLALKNELVRILVSAGHEVEDLGSHDENAVDYPDYATTLAWKIVSGDAQRGILVCGTGIGMSIAANKVPGALAALVYDEESVRLSREHNNANIIVLPGNWLSAEEAGRWLTLWLETPFEGGRHERRIGQILDFEKRDDRAKES